MEWKNYKFLAIDLALHKIYLIQNQSEKILGEFPYPQGQMPVHLSINTPQDKACFAARENGQGAIFILRLKENKLYRLPIDCPAPLQFTITPDFNQAYLVSDDATLYRIDLATLQCKALAQPSAAACSGLALSGGNICSVWETDKNGIAAIFSPNGEWACEYEISGIPTNVCCHESSILIPFTESDKYGEGLAVISENQPLRYASVQPAKTRSAMHAYPCSLTVDPHKNLAYLINEDSASISLFDFNTCQICGTFSTGRSLTNLYLLPDPRFAIATSNMFADLSMLDLVNQRLLSVTNSSREFANMLAILK